MFGLEEMKQTRYWQDAQEQEALALVTRLLRRRLGSLDPELQQQVEGLSKSQLEALGEDLIDFTSPADLSQWLQDPKG